jgi:hypothetical protein
VKTINISKHCFLVVLIIALYLLLLLQEFSFDMKMYILLYILFRSSLMRFEPRSSQTKDYKIGICCFSAKHAALRTKSKDWLAENQDNMSEWGDMSIHGLLFQWASIIKIQLSVLV